MFLTRDRCLMPPGFIAEDAGVRELLQSNQAYLADNLVRLPMRESLDEYWAKKEREYADIRQSYEGLFDVAGRRFVAANQHLVIDRDFEICRIFVTNWEEAPDSSQYWRKWVGRFPAQVVELFRRVPRQIAEEGGAVTWGAIALRLEELTRRYPAYRRLVQHVYFAIYLDGFDLRIISRLPYMRDSFGLGSGELFYDFETMRTLLEPTHLWEVLLDLPAEQMVALRKTPGYFEFRGEAQRLCAECRNSYELREAAAFPVNEVEQLLRRTAEADQLLARAGPARGLVPAVEPALEAMSQRFSDFVRAARRRRQRIDAASVSRRQLIQASLSKSPPGFEPLRAEGLALTVSDNDVLLGIFAPLREERRVLERSLDLASVRGKRPRWRGSLSSGVDVIVYSADRMGRVPAAVATCQFLTEENGVDALVILGLAGGFEESEIELGDILVPYSVADLASRKITSGQDQDADRRVRPQPFELDRRLGRYLDSQFDLRSWAHSAGDALEWPEGRFPKLASHGPGGVLASVDEVVASNDHRRELLDIWPDLLGVEMEAGGVVAAVREFAETTPVFHLRTVSDLADPAKGDNGWRRLGIKTLAHLVAAVDWHAVMEAR